MKRFLDKILDYLGLVRKSYHTAAMEGNDKFLRKLGQAAKEAGVTVVMDNDLITGATLDSDVFILGSRNVLRDCTIRGSFMAAQTCRDNAIIGCRVLGKQ